MRRLLVIATVALLIIGAGLAIAQTGSNSTKSNPDNASPQSISRTKADATDITASGMPCSGTGSGMPCAGAGSGMPCSKTGTGATAPKRSCH